MSYNIAIGKPPIPQDDKAAWEWVDEMADADDDSPPVVFHTLIDVLTERYPCICDLADVVDEEGVWSDGPLRNNINLKAPVLGIVYSRVDEVLPFLVEKANSLGLVVFDWGSETIHRPTVGDDPA